MRLNFQDEDQSYARGLFYMLTIYRKCRPFQFLSSDICMHIPIVTEARNGRIKFRNNCNIWQEIACFES